MLLVELLLWLTAALALVGGCAGNRVAWPLLASFAFCQTSKWQGWEFDKNLWATVDLATMIFIAIVLAWDRIGGARARVSGSDTAIILLFAPMLAAYELEGWTRYYLSNGLVIVQLLLIFPARRAWKCLRQTPPAPRRGLWDHFDLRVQA